MRIITTLAACVFLVGNAFASAEPAPEIPAARMPAQKAFDAVPGGSTQACVAGRLLSHVAYMPLANRPVRCSEPLSTDTLMKVHRWDRT